MLTKRRFWIFEALFKGVSTQFGARTIEKSFENQEFFFCQSLQNLRLGQKPTHRMSLPSFESSCRLNSAKSPEAKNEMRTFFSLSIDSYFQWSVAHIIMMCLTMTLTESIKVTS